MSLHTQQLAKVAADCRKAADFYTENPGLAGPGANPATITDIYRTIARLSELVEAAISSDRCDNG